MLQFGFSNFAYKKRKRYSLEDKKENCMKEPQEEREECTPVKAHQRVIPETPSSLLPSPSSRPLEAERNSPRRIVGFVKKRREFARIDSSSEEEENCSELPKDSSLPPAAHSDSKRRKLSVGFGSNVDEPVNVDDCSGRSTGDECSSANPSTVMISDSSDDEALHLPSVKRRQRRHAGTQGGYSSRAHSASTKPTGKYSSPKSSGWLSRSISKLHKKTVAPPTAIFSPGLENEVVTVSSESDGEVVAVTSRKKVICISDSDSGDCVSPLLGNTCSSAPPTSSPHPPHPLSPGRPQSSKFIKPELVDEDCGRSSGSDSEDDDYEDNEDYSDNQKMAILDFINSSSLDELCYAPGCTLTKAKMVDRLRPFKSWSGLVEAVATRKGLNEQLLEGVLCLLDKRRVLKKLLAKCQTISSFIHQRFSQLQGGASSEGVVFYSQQPLIMNPSAQLKPYQVQGLNWLTVLHSESLNGILADEMGLGKTVQAISFLAHLYQEGSEGQFLVVVPTSTIDNWVRELDVWCPAMNVITYWGSQADRSELRHCVLSNRRECDVILTTYRVCIGQAEDRRFFKRLSLDCLVLDEGHMVKNMTSQRYAYLMKIRAKRRLLLTGTPLQNNLLELMSLLSFVMPDIFQQFSSQIKKTFSRARRLDEASPYYQETVGQARQIMQPFILRRLKSEVLSELPAKVTSVEHCQLTPTQRELYRGVVQRSLRETGTNQGDSELMNRGLAVMMNLRHAANHPLLLRHHYTDERLRGLAVRLLREPPHKGADPQLLMEDMRVMSDFELHNLCLQYKSLSDHTLPDGMLGSSGKCEYLARQLPRLKEQGDRVLVFSQFTTMLDILEAFLEQEGHTHLRLDGKIPVAERQGLIDEFNQNKNVFVFLLSTRAGGLGINLTSANVVIIHDIDINPYNDKQAEDRCHRLGQTRDVTVVRLVAKETVEEEILLCAQSKLRLEQDLTTSSTDEAMDMTALLQKVLSQHPQQC